MIATIDKAGRLVIPKSIRDAMGLQPGAQLAVDYVNGKIEIDYAPVEAWVATAEDGLPILETSAEVSWADPTDDQLREAIEEARDEGTARYL